MLAGGVAVHWTLPWTLAAYCAFDSRRMKLLNLRDENRIQFLYLAAGVALLCSNFTGSNNSYRYSEKLNNMSPSSLNNVPALAPPTGVTPDFVNPYTLSPAFVATAVLCLLFATTALIIRLATSLFGLDRRLRIEDCMLFQDLVTQTLSVRMLI